MNQSGVHARAVSTTLHENMEDVLKKKKMKNKGGM
jgi:hypothetical protein